MFKIRIIMNIITKFELSANLCFFYDNKSPNFSALSLWLFWICRFSSPFLYILQQLGPINVQIFVLLFFLLYFCKMWDFDFPWSSRFTLRSPKHQNNSLCEDKIHMDASQAPLPPLASLSGTLTKLSVYLMLTLVYIAVWKFVFYT